jgi:tetratricopeptide (TPR) repeat protein
MNGFNGDVEPQELERDLQEALRDFDEASSRDPHFVDASVGAISCLQNLAHLSRTRKDAARASELVARFVPMFRKSLAAAPDNPRLLWVLGANQFNNPPERGGGQAIALATYKKGLELARRQKGTVKDPLEPAWGEPELLMRLAWASLNQSAPEIPAAEEYAKRALALVPYWHYVRNTLLPQIRRATEKK